MTVGEIRRLIKHAINDMGKGIYAVLVFLIVISIMMVQFTILLWPYSGYTWCAAAVFFYVVNRVRKWAEPEDTKSEGTLLE